MPGTTQSWFKDILVLTLIVGFMYSMFLGARPLTPPDEGRYSEIPREMVASGDYITPRLNGIKYFEKPILFYWLQSLSIKAFGLHEWNLRLCTALMGLLGCLLTYWGTRTIYDRQSALLAAFILGSSVLYAGLANFITLDMSVSVFLTGSLLCFLVGNRSPPGKKRRNYMWLMYMFAGFATLTKGLIGILFPGMIILAWLCITQQLRQLSSYCLLSGTCIFLAITAPWHILVQLNNPEFFHFYFIEQHFLRYLTNYADRVQPKWFFPLILTVGFFPWTGFLLSALKRQWPLLKRPQAHPTEIFLLLWGALIFLFYWLSKSQLSPYILPVFTPAAMLTGRFIHLNWDKQNLKFGFYFSLVASVIISVGVLIYIHLLLHAPLAVIDLLPLCVILFGLGTFYYKKTQTRRGLIFIIASSLYILTLASMSYELFDNRSIKPLALELAGIIEPKDEIYNFNHYYQDLPVYLKRDIKVINWTGELSFGSQHQDIENIFLNEERLINEWPSEIRKFLIAKKCDLNYLRNHLNMKFYVIDTKKNCVLICNQEIQK